MKLSNGRRDACFSGSSSPETPSGERAEFRVGLLIVSILCCLTFAVFWGIRFSNSDDMFFSVSLFDTVRDYFKLAGRVTLETGRIGDWYTSIYWLISAKLWDTPLYDVALLGSVSAVLVAFLAFARRLRCLSFALLAVTLYLSCIEGTARFNPLLSYPFRYTSGILIFLAALLCFDLRLSGRSRVFTLLGCLFSFIAFTHHETLFAVFASVGILFIIWRQSEGSFLERFRRHGLPFSTTVVVYVLLYVTWRIFQPITYVGTEINIGGTNFIAGYLAAVRYYVLASMPLFHGLYGMALVYIDGASSQYAAMPIVLDPKSLIGAIEPRSVLRACIVAGAVLFATRRLEANLTQAVLLRIATVGLLILILPALVISVSPIYQTYVANGYAPLHPTFFGYFGAIMLIVSVIAAGLRILAPSQRAIASVILAIGLATCSLFADAFNVQIANSLRINTQRWTVAALLLRHWEAVPQAEVPRSLVAPQLWNYVGDVGPLPENYWGRLFKLNGGPDVAVSQTPIRGESERRAELYFDCAEPDNCLVLLHREWDGAVEVISTAPRPRFLMSYGAGGRKDFKIILQPEKQTTWLRRGAFSGVLKDPDVVFGTLRPTM